MIRTIMIGSSILVQGLFERSGADGTIVIRVGDKCFTGKPVLRSATSAA